MIDPIDFNVEEGESPLKKIRELLGVSQEEFGRRIGVTGQTVSRWERGIWPATFTLAQIRALRREIKALGLDLDDIPDDLGPKKAQAQN